MQATRDREERIAMQHDETCSWLESLARHFGYRRLPRTGPGGVHIAGDTADASFSLFSMLAPLGFLALLSPLAAHPNSSRIVALFQNTPHSASAMGLFEGGRTDNPAMHVYDATPSALIPGYEHKALFSPDDLVSPAGVAIDPRNGNVFIAEQDAARIRVVTQAGCPIVVDARTPIYADDSMEHRRTPLRNPSELDFVAGSAGGVLYIVENTPARRVLAFSVDENGRARAGTVANTAGQ